MKVVLLNPTVDFARQFGTLKDFYAPIPSIGLAYIGAVLKQAGFDVTGIDSFIACDTPEAMRQKVMAQRPDILGISLLTPAAPMVEKILPDLRRDLPNMKVVLGNIHASRFPEHYLRDGLADFVVHHEGEATMLELVEALRDGKDTSEIHGISYWKDGKEVRTPKREWIAKIDLDEMPHPLWEIFPVEQFKPDIRLMGRGQTNKQAEVQALPILASRGCPFNCLFCSPVNTIGRRYTMRTPKNVVDEMEHFHRKYGVTSFYYMDLTFPINEKLGIEFCDELIARRLPVTWITETRVSGVTYPLLRKMKESGCTRVDFGIECGNQKMLDRINKQFTIRQVEDAVAMANLAGIETEGLFIIGLPDETLQDTWDTINFALHLGLDHIKLNIFVPYPGSDLFDELLLKGQLNHLDWGAYGSYPSYTGTVPAYVPPGRSHAELLQLQRIGMRKAFFRRKVILRELRHFKMDRVGQYVNAVKGLLLKPQPTDTTADRLATSVG